MSVCTKVVVAVNVCTRGSSVLLLHLQRSDNVTVAMQARFGTVTPPSGVHLRPRKQYWYNRSNICVSDHQWSDMLPVSSAEGSNCKNTLISATFCKNPFSPLRFMSKNLLKGERTSLSSPE
jgi:hypothetical protein